MGSLIARAVVFNEQGQLLMVERHKNGQHYFVLPGGHADKGETAEQAVLREVQEETGLVITVDKALYTYDDKFGNHHQIYLCEYKGGEPSLQPASIEVQVMAAGTEAQEWKPAWFDMAQLDGQTIYPIGLLKCLKQDKAGGFHHNPYKIIERSV